MYVTRPLSHYHRFPEAAAEQPDGPGSGFLALQDEEAEAELTCCWGLCWTTQMYDLPFPQNRMLKVRYSSGVGKSRRTYRDDVFFIPVVAQPLSFNRYYVVKAGGRHKGKVCTCSRNEDQTSFFLWTFTNDVEPNPFNPQDIYQQVEITYRNGNFKAKAVAPDGIPPQFLRRKGWSAYTSVPSHYILGEAQGLDGALRAHMPDLNFPLSLQRSHAVVVGKWYTPFIFVSEEGQLKDQMKRSMFYEITLQQYWEQIFSCENDKREGNTVEVSVSVRREMALLNGSEMVQSRTANDNGFVFFNPVNSVEKGLGLSRVVWERMRWEEERGGWVGGEEVGRVNMAEVFDGQGSVGWEKFGCYVLVERFALKRMDGSLAFTYEFRHTNKIRVKWE